MGRERSAFHRGPESLPSNEGRIHLRRPTLSLSFFACNSAADHTWTDGQLHESWLPAALFEKMRSAAGITSSTLRVQAFGEARSLNPPLYSFISLSRTNVFTVSL